MRIRMTAKTIFAREIRANFNTCRTLEVTEVSYLVILLYRVIVVRRKIAPNCLQTRYNVSKHHHVMFRRLYLVISLLLITQKFPAYKPIQILIIKTTILILCKYHAWVTCEITSHIKIRSTHSHFQDSKKERRQTIN